MRPKYAKTLYLQGQYRLDQSRVSAEHGIVKMTTVAANTGSFMQQQR